MQGFFQTYIVAPHNSSVERKIMFFFILENTLAHITKSNIHIFLPLDMWVYESNGFIVLEMLDSFVIICIIWYLSHREYRIDAFKLGFISKLGHSIFFGKKLSFILLISTKNPFKLEYFLGNPYIKNVILTWNFICNFWHKFQDSSIPSPPISKRTKMSSFLFLVSISNVYTKQTLILNVQRDRYSFSIGGLSLLHLASDFF